ncbi:MAG: sulfotransferase domain-containing protein [Chloroflexi bacterium]|nr:sulfotransferase domain-containing protein [Chloroflexota bacterium]
MKTPLVLSIGMPRAGSGWHYNLIHNLIVASGGQDSRQIRRRYLLQSILTEVNCNIGAFTPHRLLPVMIPALLGNTFVVKAHAGPTPLALRFIRSGKLLPAYIYRDPRDALLSAYEYGQRKREKGRAGAFSELITIEQAIEFMREYVCISEDWLACEQALHVRYEDLLTEYDVEVQRLVDFLGFDGDSPAIQSVLDDYRPDRGRSVQKGTHFVKGKIGRYRHVFTSEQRVSCIEAFGPYLERMGYPRE